MNSDSIRKYFRRRVHILLTYEHCNLFKYWLSKLCIRISLKGFYDESNNNNSDLRLSIEEELV